MSEADRLFLIFFVTVNLCAVFSLFFLFLLQTASSVSLLVLRQGDAVDSFVLLVLHYSHKLGVRLDGNFCGRSFLDTETQKVAFVLNVFDLVHLSIIVVIEQF